MKYKLLTSTAVGAVLAATSYAYAEGVTLKFFGGLNLLGDEKFKGVITPTSDDFGDYGVATYGVIGEFDFESDTGYVFGGAVGYQWNNGLILEVEAAYRRNQLDIEGGGNLKVTKHFTTSIYDYLPSDTATFTTSDGFVNFDDGGHISAVSLMANAWYEFNLANEQWKPYVGGGVGIAWLDMHGLVNYVATTTESTSPSTGVFGFHGTESGFAWQLGAGIGYEFAPGKQITLDYRYFNGPEMNNVQFHEVENDIDYDYSAHNIMIGVRLGL